jgi:hypothetical protein
MNKTFKFDFIKDKVHVIFEFSTNISLIEDGKKLGNDILKQLKGLDKNYGIENFESVFSYLLMTNKISLKNYSKKIELFVVLEEDWGQPNMDYKYFEYPLSDINKYIGDCDFYYSIASIGYKTAEGYNGYTIITRRIKDNGIYSYNNIYQAYCDDCVDGEYYSIELYNVNCVENIPEAKVQSRIRPIFEEQGFDEKFKYLPIHIPGKYILEDLSECIDILVDIENIHSTQDFRKN